ncbi:MAG: hypothetical protein ACUVQY_03105 [Thermoproteota archaeon]
MLVLTGVTIPPELAWIIPIVVPFIIGLLVGLVIKRTLKLVLAIALLVIILIVTGYVSLTFQDIFDRAMEFLPKIIDLGGGLQNILPYSSATFLIGLILGLWKG